MKKYLFLLPLLLVAMQQVSAAKAATTTVVCGNAQTGLATIPFGGLYNTQPYQQLCNPGLFPSGNLVLTNIKFTSNPAYKTGLVNYNVTIIAGQSWYTTTNMSLNLGPKPQVVYNGPISAILTGAQGDLNFVLLKKNPFTYNPRNGYLVIQVVVWEGDDTAFLKDFDPNVFQVFQPLGSVGNVIEYGGLNMIIQGNQNGGK